MLFPDSSKKIHKYSAINCMRTTYHTVTYVLFTAPLDTPCPLLYNGIARMT